MNKGEEKRAVGSNMIYQGRIKGVRLSPKGAHISFSRHESQATSDAQTDPIRRNSPFEIFIGFQLKKRPNCGIIHPELGAATPAGSKNEL